MKWLMLIGCLVVCPHVMSQDYVVTADQDTLYGVVKMRNAKLNIGLQVELVDKIKFIHSDGRERFFEAKDINGFTTKGKRFESIYKPVTHTEELQLTFGEVQVKGRASLYLIMEMADNPHYDDDDDGNAMEPRKRIEKPMILQKGEDRPIRLSTYKKQLFNQLTDYLSDNEQVVQDIRKNKYKKNQVDQIVRDYNRVF